MAEHRDIVQHHAVLIGIDSYPDRPLYGCVQDVREIKSLLEVQSLPVNVHTLVGVRNINDGACTPAERNARLPTYENVISAFQIVLSLANPGDFVYIHYAGHGTRGDPTSKFSNESTGDLALVLLDEKSEDGVRLLWGHRLALLLNGMVVKRLAVTLVLDCCFSASVYRHDNPGVRFLPYDPEAGSKFSSDPDDILEDEKLDLPTSRDASMLPNWLINPDGYAILTACGPHEEAIEFKPKNGPKHGALCYFLLPLIRSGGLTKKHKDIYHYLCAKFRESTLQQNPVLYGNKDQGFFGRITGKSTSTPISIVKRGKSLELQAGKAHGVCTGDQFAVYPSDLAETASRPAGELVLARVSQVKALTSDLELLDGSPTVQVQTGWMARSHIRSLLHKFPIQLASNLSNLEEWMAILAERLLDGYTSQGRSSCSFQVVLNNGEYEILDSSGQNMLNLPTMPQDRTDVSYICDILEHLARFKLVEDIANETPQDSFRDSIDAKIITPAGSIYTPGSVVELEQDESAKYTFELQISNKGTESLYAFLYNMGPFWQVEDLYRGTYEVIPPQNRSEMFTGTFRKKLKTSIPVEMLDKGHLQCEDIIKVFITSQPTSFDLLDLPKIDGIPKKSSSSRTGEGGPNLSEDWVALNFHIRTSVNEEF
ncbi:hypothetical protein EDB80DRAFT_279163 [Ilyonectria destructans]|nr:hypothetical protein EDB80DRAFT_279163 [Ilyonectria destructans]